MTTKSIPDMLRQSLESHMAESDLRDDPEMKEIMGRLSELSVKVAAAKAKVLARRKQAK